MIKLKFYFDGKLLRGEAHSKNHLKAILSYLSATSVTYVFTSENGLKQTIQLPRQQKRTVQTGYNCSCGEKHYTIPISPGHKVLSQFKYY